MSRLDLILPGRPASGYYIPVKLFFQTLPRNIIACFSGWRIGWHLLAIGLTLLLVFTGTDWQYYLATRNPTLTTVMFYSAPIGGLLPLLLPLVLIFGGLLAKSPIVNSTGWAIGQAELIGSLISSAYKAVTARAHPAWTAGADLSHVFHFGLLRGGVFWGWPSSHTTIAFAMAGAVAKLFPRRKWLVITAFIYALFIGLGVSMTIHWLSDFMAGAIIGLVIGTVVGKSFAATNISSQ